MAIDKLGYVAVAEIIVYTPALICAFIVCWRHGWRRASGWIYTLLLCIVRITGSICQLVTYTNHSQGLLTATFIIDSIGLSPLLFATLGMVSRFVDKINEKGNHILGIKHFRLVQLVITLGLILSIVGGTSATPSANGTITQPATTKAGIILYLVAFCAICLILIISSRYTSSVTALERRIPMAVAVALPLILVRLLYSIIAIFANDHKFSIISGSIGVRVGMAVVEEFLVVVIYLILGFCLPKVQAEGHVELATRPWSDRRGNRRRR